MLMINRSCDFCGGEIKGVYYKVETRNHADDLAVFSVKNPLSDTSKDMCIDCMKMVTDYKRVPVLSYGEVQK